MIVDLLPPSGKEQFITDRVASIERQDNFFIISYGKSPKTWKYRSERIFYAQDPEAVDLDGRGLYVRKKRVKGAQEILRFTDGKRTFWHITYKSGFEWSYNDADVYLSRTNLQAENHNLWDFLNHIVNETGLTINTDADEAVNILQLQYEQIDVERDNTPLALYMAGKRRGARFSLPAHVFFPFGCNGSQKQAVENALTNQVSIIQGPPGTGKTQTILNIIANLLLQGKSILVVSNNNSAVDNVAEKLSSKGVGLGFLVAKLGSVENREHFIENQPPYPDMTSWKLQNEGAVIRKVDAALNVATTGFGKQVDLARLKAEYAALITEQKYENLQNTTESKQDLWLSSKPSAKLMALLTLLQKTNEHGKRFSLWTRLKWSFSLGWRAWSMLGSKNAPQTLEVAFYQARKAEIEKEMAECEAFIEKNDIKGCVDQLRQCSLDYLKSCIAEKYNEGWRTKFEKNEIKGKSAQFLAEYPVVLSTTYSAKSCISPDMVFDYVIMDEASQVDIATGALALSCAENVVIVGDDKQLPNVIDSKTFQVIEELEDNYKIDDKYCITKHSFLSSCNHVFKNTPTTLLREHYRCHPQIIEFCNKMFYDGELVTMTNNDGKPDTLGVFLTPVGNHARDHVNQREIDVIKQEVMPALAGDKSVGIISPYRNQTEQINLQLNRDIASTVHKFQGRECDAIIMSMVDNSPTSFSDDANLLNVAISRAKSKLCIVATGNEIPEQSILSQLINYIRYNNFEVRESKLHSVFDILYSQYTQERLLFERTHEAVSSELSENVIYATLNKAIEQNGLKGKIGILDHYPLARLITDRTALNAEEEAFVESNLSHIDFLLYNTITKQPKLCIEVDGWKYHNTDVQRHRDHLKDAILTKFHLPINRLSTTSLVTVETLAELLKKRL